MRFAVIFEDTLDTPAVRLALEADHLDFLAAHAGEIRMAGGLRPDPGSPHVGGLWVLEVPSRERALALIEADPYARAHARPYRLLVWGKALPQAVTL